MTEEGVQFHASAVPVRELLQVKSDPKDRANFPDGAITFGKSPFMSAAIGPQDLAKTVVEAVDNQQVDFEGILKSLL